MFCIKNIYLGIIFKGEHYEKNDFTTNYISADSFTCGV